MDFNSERATLTQNPDPCRPNLSVVASFPLTSQNLDCLWASQEAAKASVAPSAVG